METLNSKQVLDKVDKLATNEFLKSLTTIAKLYGWYGDYIEVREFVEWIYDAKKIEEPNLAPYEMDDFDNIIIP